MARKKDMRIAAHAHSVKKLKQLQRVEMTCDEVSKKFILAQKLLVVAEEQIVFAAANAIAMNVSSRHLGMAFAQALIEPLSIIGSVVKQHRGEVEFNELLYSFFGRTLEIAQDEFGLTDISVERVL